MIMKSNIPHKTIFKPSVIMPAENQIYSDHLLQFAKMLVRIHKGAETVRRYIEDGLRLPELRPVFRAPGNPDGTLNLIHIEDVASAMAEIESDGTYYLTNSDAPRLKNVAEWIGEMILLDFKIVPEFKEMPLEIVFQRMGKAFLPYLRGDNLPRSDIKCHPVTREYIHKVVANSVLGEQKL
jgi:nucleoside-diphosphate-sugar epimerase